MLSHCLRPLGFLPVLYFLCTSFAGVAQKKYQSLMWEITGNGLEKPSYIYGTMHISGKMVFHLGEPFYEAMKNVDVLALELEPEAWLQAIFDDTHNQMWQSSEMRGDEFGYNWNNSDLPSLDEYFKLNMELQGKLRLALMYNPELLNYLLYRFGSYSYGADYEEDTWLDMYLYQTGKKLGKRTIGLETYEQSDAFYKQAVKESQSSKDQKFYDEEDREEMARVGEQMETAYRTQDLDLIDSLNKKITDPAFDKYILLERNKVFVHCMDSVLKKGQSLFAGMGCAHLPGDSGVVEMIRHLGYTVRPFNKGERNVKTRGKIDASIFKRPSIAYQSTDKEIAGTAPHTMYPMFQSDEASAMISLDIPNAASFMIYRIKSYAGLKDWTPEQILASIDSSLYEVVAGDIVSQKRISRNGFQGIEVYNKNRRGDIHRKQIYLTNEEVIVFQLTSSGDKVSKGYGDEFFSSIVLSSQANRPDPSWTSQDGTLKVFLPGEVRYYEHDFERFESPDYSVSASDSQANYYLIQRHTIEDPEFFDDDSFESNRLMTAFLTDNDFEAVNRTTVRSNGRCATQAAFNFNQKQGYALALLHGLSYYVFTVFTEDPKRAEEFFTHIEFLSGRHSSYHVYNDTTYHFKVELPFDYEPYEDLDSYYYFESGDEESNAFESSAGSGVFAVPGHAELIQLQYKRSNAFSDPDSAKYVQGWMEEVVKNDGFQMKHFQMKRTESGLEATFLYGDTACGRVNLTRKIQHFKTLYTITTTYDSLTGAGEFVNHFMQTFSPTDSTYHVRHFDNQDKLFLDSLEFGSTETRRQIAELLGEVDLDFQSTARVRGLIQHMPLMNDEDDQNAMKRFLLEALNEDTSQVNLQFIKAQYYQHVDSSKTQILLLRELLEMKNKRAFALYQELILDEPPITGQGSGAFDLLHDSLELAVPLFPGLLSLVTLDEYELPAYNLVTALLDSALVKPKLYEKQLSYIVLEAKNELKRLTSQKELSYYPFNKIITYLRLLLPYQDRPEVKAIFDKAARIRNPDWLLEYVTFQLNNEIVPADSLIQKIVLKGEMVTSLYGEMHLAKQTSNWPKEWSNRDTLVMNYMKVRFANKYNKKVGVDTISIFQKKMYTMRDRPFEIYYIKFKLKEASSWLGLVLAFDQTEPNNLWPNVLESTENIVIDEDESEMNEFEKAMRILEESNRRFWRWKNGNNQFLF
jgi:uncharacterized protein YbaP (TraB family)